MSDTLVLPMCLRTFFFVLLCCIPAAAEVVRIEVQERTPVLDGKPFGSTGAYERLKGRVHFEVDPAFPANRIISDIQLRSAQPTRPGRVFVRLLSAHSARC